MSRRYAKGRHAVAECQRSGQKMKYRDLVEDGHIPGLLVHPDWWEPRHPQETPPDMTDPIALARPAPEISVPAGYGDAENLDGGTQPTAPLGADICTTSGQAVGAGDTQVVLNQALTYNIGQWVFIALDGGGYFSSRITTTADTPSFTIPFTTPFAGAAAQGNQVCIGTGWAAVTQTYAVTIGDYGHGSGERIGYTTYGGPIGSVIPDPPLVTGEDGKLHLLREVTCYEPATNGIEIFFETGTQGSDPTAQILFTTFSSIELDHAGGTLVLDTRDTGSGGDMNQGASTEGGYADFWFPGVARIWTSAHIGNQYQMRLIP